MRSVCSFEAAQPIHVFKRKEEAKRPFLPSNAIASIILLERLVGFIFIFYERQKRIFFFCFNFFTLFLNLKNIVIGLLHPPLEQDVANIVYV